MKDTVFVSEKGLNEISQGIEAQYDEAMDYLWRKYHLRLRAEPAYHPTLEERLQDAYYQKLSEVEK